MKKSLTIILEDEELLELMRLLMDDDAQAALAFLKEHFKGKARELLEGGGKVMIQVPGAGTASVSSNLFKL